jgi:hypothetical protein
LKLQGYPSGGDGDAWGSVESRYMGYRHAPLGYRCRDVTGLR